ncbi:MAG: UbiA family prenyltransferase [Candidatus Lokiarchaeota archaeon]|nr:UbiA family prenyltransferase [Candidatus Lokiarchaeota archaeon]
MSASEPTNATGNRWAAVRLDYLFVVVIPCLIALYTNKESAGFSILDHVKTILGWAFLGIAGNVINDMVDKDRDTGWRAKELAAVAVGSICLALLCFIDAVAANPLNVLWIGTAIGLVLAYNFGMKRIPLASGFVQVFAEICMPYFTIHVPDDAVEWLWLASLYLFGVLSQFMHEALDRDALAQRFSPERVRLVVMLFSILTLAAGAILFFLSCDFNIVPIAFVPVACIYIFRAPRASSGNIKSVGIILGNLFMAYFVVMLLS